MTCVSGLRRHLDGCPRGLVELSRVADGGHVEAPEQPGGRAPQHTRFALGMQLPRAFSGTVPFATLLSMGGEFTSLASDLRHRTVFNGIWQVGRGFQVSGIYFIAAGQRAQTTPRRSPEYRRRRRRRDACPAAPASHGSVVPRNSHGRRGSA